MAGGLSPNQLRSLLQDYGSWEAAIEARPDLADQLRGMQRMAETIAGQVQAIKHMTESIRPALMRVPEPKPLLVENKIETQAAAFELALARHARRQMKQATLTGKKTREYKTQEFSHAMLIKAIRLLGDQVPITSKLPPGGIAEQTGLDRHLVAKIREYAAGRGYEARRGQKPGMVVLVRVSKTAP
jgi:hypothetical protein